MAENIGAMYVSIDGRDLISKKLERIQKQVNATAKDFELIEGLKVGKNINFDYAKKTLADLSQYYIKLQDQMRSRASLQLDTRDIKRELDEVMFAIKKIYSELGTSKTMNNFLSAPFRSTDILDENGKKAGEIQGIKEKIDEYSKSILESAKAHTFLQREQNAISMAAEKMASDFSVAQNKIQKYMNAIDRRITSLDATRMMPHVSPETVAAIENEISKLKELKALWEYMKNDKSSATSRLDWSFMLTEQADAIGRAKMAQRTGIREDNQGRAIERRVESEAKAIDRSYSNLIRNTTNKLEDLKRVRDSISNKISEGAKAGADVSGLQRQMSHLQAVIKELRGIYSMSKGDVVGRNANGRTPLDEIYAKFKDLKPKIKAEVAEINKTISEIGRVDASQKRYLDTLTKVNAESAKFSNIWAGLKNQFMLFGAGFGIQQLFDAIVKTGGEIEKQHIALRSIIGDLQNADHLFGQIKGLALSSPFTFSELNRDVKQLAAYGVAYNDIYDTTKRLADISSGLGVSFERIALAYGQVKSRSWLDGKELRQFAYAGIPLLEKLSEMYTKSQGKSVSQADVRKMISGRQVSFEDVQKVLWDLTDEGGKFYNMQETLSQTLLGRYNKLIDALEIMWSEFAKGDSIVGGTFKKLLNFATEIVLGFNKAIGVVTAFFSVFAMRKLGGAIYGAVGGNMLRGFLANKNEHANRLQKEALAGKQLDAVEKQILATKNRITQADLTNLQLAGAITKKEQQRLMTVNAMRSSYIRLLASMRMMNMQGAKGALGGIMSNAGSLAMTGLKSAFSGIMGFFGGAAGLGVTALTMMYANYKERQQEIESTTKAITEGVKDRYDRLTEYLKNNPLQIGLDEKNARNQLKSLEKMYQDMTGENFVFFGDVDDDKLSGYIETQLMLLNTAQKEAKKYVDVFANAEADTDNWGPDDNIVENIKDWQDAYSALLSAKGEMKESARSEYYSATSELRGEIDTMYDYISRRLQGVSPELRGKVFNVLRDAWISSKEGLTPYAEDIIKLMFDEKMGIDKAHDFAKIVGREGGLDLKRTINEELRSGKTFEEIAKGTTKDMIEASMKKVQEEFPNYAKEIQKLFDDNTFYMNVVALTKGDVDVNALEQTMLGRIPKMLDNETKKRYEALIKSQTQSGSFSELKSAAKKDLDKAKKEYDDALEARSKGEISQSMLDAIKRDYEDAKAVWDLYGFKDEDKKKGRGTGRTEDKQLREWRDLLALLKQMNGEYEKWVTLLGKEGAKKKLAELGDFERLAKVIESITGKKIDFSDRIGNADAFFQWAKNLEKANKLTTEQRKRWKDEVQKFDIDEHYGVDKKAADARAEKMIREFDEEKRRYDKFSQLRGRYGDSMAATYALFGGDKSEGVSVDFQEAKQKMAKSMTEGFNDLAETIVTGTTSLSMEWESILMRKIGGVADANGDFHSADDIINMTSDTLQELYGDKTKDVEHMLQELRNVREKAADETIEEVYKVMDLIKTPAMAVARIQAASKEQKRKLGKDSPFVNIVDALAKWQEFETTTTYADVMNRANTLDKDWKKEAFAEYRKNLAAKKDTMTDEEYKKALDELNKKEHDRTGMLFGAPGSVSSFMTGGLEGLLSYYEKRRDGFSKDSEQYKEGQKRVDAVQSWVDALNTGADAIAIATGVFNGLSQAAQALSDMFYALGDKANGDAFSDINDAIGGISSILSPANNIVGSAMKGDVSGILSNAISAPIQMFAGPITAFSKLHDKKLQRQIEELEKQNTNLQNLKNIMQKGFERALGGVYANGQEGYYQSQKANLQKQAQNIQSMINAENSKKNTDDSVVEQYKTQLAEINDQLKWYANDMANTLYGIDFKGWAGQMADALVGAWSQGMSAAHAYKEVVTNIMKQVATNVVDQAIIQKMIEPQMSAVMAALDASGGKVTDDVLRYMAELYDSADVAAEAAYNFLDNAERLAQEHGTSWKENSQGMYASIAGVTEDTANLLGAYINKISTDTGAIRGYEQMIADNTAQMLAIINHTGSSYAKGNGATLFEDEVEAYSASLEESIRMSNAALQNIAMEQLPMVANHLALMMADIKLIEANTGRSADASEGIYDILDKLTNGSGQKAMRMEV